MEQAVLEMNDDLVKMRQATAQVSHMILRFIEIALVIVSFNWHFISSIWHLLLLFLICYEKKEVEGVQFMLKITVFLTAQ